jgi:Fur family peroxide stress response transcriptional regulator
MMDADHRLTEIKAKLKKQGYRMTPQRMAIIKLLALSDGHPSVEQIYAQVRQDFPMTSLATIYKTVNLLKEEGEILELGFANGSNRYDGNKPYPHPHLICVKCQKIIDPDISILSELPQELAQKYGYQMVNHRLDFYGICPECQKETG